MAIVFVGELAERVARETKMAVPEPLQRRMISAGMRARYSSPRGLRIQLLPGNAAPPANSDGTPATMGVYSIPNCAAA